MGKNSKNKRSANRNYSTQQGAGASPAVNTGQPDQNQVDVAETEKPVEVQELTEVQKPAEVQQLTEDMVIQFGAHEVSAAEISEKVKKSYLSGEGSAEINKLKIYVKPEDNKAYYVVNDETEGNVELVSD